MHERVEGSKRIFWGGARLAERGSDTVTNADALCPNCNREMHYGKNCKELALLLYKSIDRLILE